MSGDKNYDLYLGMPEYDNITQSKPAIEATFKFRTRKDYDAFIEAIQPIFGERIIFTGRQLENRKSTWYPQPPKGSDYEYK